MSSFAVFIEFCGSLSPAKSDRLDECLANVGLCNRLNGQSPDFKDKLTVGLPKRLYFGDFELSPPEMAESVYMLAVKIHPVSSIFVAETQTWSLKQ